MAGLADVAELVVLLKLKDEISRPLKNLDKGIASSARNAESASYKIGAGIGQSIKNIAKIGVAGGVAVAGFSIAGVKWAADLEAQLHTINTVANVTPEKLKGIGDALRGISRDTGISLDELTSSYYDLVSAGIKVGDAQSVLNDAVKLGIGGLATTQETVDLLTTAYNTYGLNAAGATKATDMFAQAIADGKVKANEIAASFANVAPIAKASGVGIDQIAASYAYLTAQGVPAAEVTTEMNRAIVSLLAPTSSLKAAGKALGVSWDQEIRKKGLVPALQEIRDYSAKTGIPLQKLFGRIEAVKYVLQTTGPQAAGFAAELDKIRKASGVAAAQAGEREQGLAFQFGRLQAIVRDAGITIGTHLLPPLADLAEKLNDLIIGHEGDLDKFGQMLAEMFSPANISGALGFVQNIIPSLIEGLKLTGQIARTTIGIFAALPPEVKGLLVGALAVHKLSGGLLTGGLLDAIKAPLEQFFGRGSPANPMFVYAVNGGLGGPGGGLPGVAGGGGGLLGALGGGSALVGGAIAASAVAAGVATGLAQNAGNQVLRNNGIKGSVDLNPLNPLGGPIGTLSTAVEVLGRAIGIWGQRNETPVLDAPDQAAGTTQPGDTRSELRGIRNAVKKADTHNELRGIAIATRGVRSSLGDTRSELRRIGIAARANTIATRQATEAIKDKDLSVTVPVTLTTAVSVHLSALSRNEAIVQRLNGRASSVR